MALRKSNTSIIRKDLMIRIFRLILQEKTEELDRIPLLLKPRGRDPWRCCLHKDRAVLKYKIMSILGYAEEDETDELTPLSWYGEHARGSQNRYLNLISEACSNCPSASYVVTNLCRGCEARPCQVNCPKNSITFKNGQAFIDTETCVSCGLCMRNCPYNAIQFQPRPCEEVCPVNAISTNAEGHEEIDMEKCILCGRCMQSCPFGAIIPSSDVPQIIQDIKSETEVVAIVAPAIAGQFRAPLEQIYGAIKAVGFTSLYEVAEGAELTARQEADELVELLKQSENPGLMSSCCPAWVDYVEKNQPSWCSSISHTPSPMVLSAIEVRKIHPNAKIAFIGPCLAKKGEARKDPNVNYAMSFEELGALIVAHGVEVAEQDPYSLNENVPELGRNFALSGGVAQSVSTLLGMELKVHQVSGLNKETIRQLKRAVKDKKSDFFEVMCCEGGCVGGAQTLTSASESVRIINS
ncbi:MAG: monomeric [FeFe] hydrogenase [Salinivirgaceae bacterium]|nr:monomeric [FeFe] hydrogenase [Salinivirgaceae bacterium]MDD4747764.1 monomeric [FeFe] hydrogenase [Salinivirgaceae bacterium]